MKISSLNPKNILMRDQRVVKMLLFFIRKIMVGSNFLLVIHIPQDMEVSKNTDVLNDNLCRGSESPFCGLEIFDLFDFKQWFLWKSYKSESHWLSLGNERAIIIILGNKEQRKKNVKWFLHKSSIMTAY